MIERVTTGPAPRNQLRNIHAGSRAAAPAGAPIPGGAVIPALLRNAVPPRQHETRIGPAAVNRRETVASQLTLRSSLSEQEGPSLEVRRMVARYVPQRASSVGRPLARVLTWVAKIESLIVQAQGQGGDLAEGLVLKDARRQVFLLEGILRLYTERFGRPVKECLAIVKELEDELGAYADARKLVQLAKDKGMPAQVIEHLERGEAKAHKKALKVLGKEWVQQADGRIPAIATLVEELSAQKWDDYAADRKYLKSELARRAEKVGATDYDMKDLQGGLHELRRHLRWFPVYAEALDGLIVLDERRHPVPALASMLADPLASSKFVTLPAPARETEPLRFSKSLYTGVIKLVLDFGGLKDDGEAVEFLTQAYVESGAAKSKSKAHDAVVEALGEGHGPVTEQAEALYRGLREKGVLAAVRAEFLERF